MKIHLLLFLNKLICIGSMCNAWNCLEWPTIFIFFPFKGDLFEPARFKLLPEIRDTSKGAIMPSTPDIFSKNKRHFHGLHSISYYYTPNEKI